MAPISDVLAHVDANLDASLERLFAFLRYASIGTDRAFDDQTRDCAEWLNGQLAGIGFETSVRQTPGQPIVLGRQNGPKSAENAPHLLFYGHYDVQPVDPLDLWTTDPFEPKRVTLEPGRDVIVARGACDDKGQVMTFVEACRAWKAVTGSLPVGITMLVEGEEESGSVNLPAFLKAHAAELKADLALVCDTGMWDRHTPAITTSLRGLVFEELTIHAADRDLHSGLFGGAAANPLRVLAKILAAMHDESGRVTIPGFYERVHELPPDVKADWLALNLTPGEFLGQIGLSTPSGEHDRALIEMVQSRPTAEINGMWGGYTGPGSKTVIPGQAHAKVSFRLVGDQDPDAIRSAFRAFVEARLPPDCRVGFESHSASRAIALDWGMPALAKARAALTDEWGRKAVLIGSGGSIPVVGDFKRTLGIDTLLVGFGLDDDRVHSPNEKYDLSSFHKGIRSWVRILAALAERD